MRSWRGRVGGAPPGVDDRADGEDVDGHRQRLNRASKTWRRRRDEQHAFLVVGETGGASGAAASRWVAANELSVRWQRTAQNSSPLRHIV